MTPCLYFSFWIPGNCRTRHMCAFSSRNKPVYVASYFECFCVLSTCQIGLFVFIFFQLNISLLSKFSRTWHTCGALKPVWSRSRDKGLGGRTPPFHCSWWWWQPSPSVFVFVFVCICIFCICICEWLWCVFDERQRVPILLLVGWCKWGMISLEIFLWKIEKETVFLNKWKSVIFLTKGWVGGGGLVPTQAAAWARYSNPLFPPTVWVQARARHQLFILDGRVLYRAIIHQKLLKPKMFHFQLDL